MFTSHICNGRREDMANSKSSLGYNSKDVCVQNTMTNSRVTADLDKVAFLLESGQTEQLSLRNNSLERSCGSQAISMQLNCAEATKTSEENDRGVPNGDHVKTEKHSIEAVSRSLDELMASGKALLEDLASTNSKKLRSYQTEGASTSDRSVEIDSSAEKNRRGTYDLGKLAAIVDDSVEQGVSLEESLNEISQDINGNTPAVSSTPSKIRRDTYDLSDVSEILDESEQSGTSLEELLKELGCEEDGVNDDISPRTRSKRGTYDLSDVSSRLDDSLGTGKSLEAPLAQVSLSGDDHQQIPLQDKTNDLSDVPSQLDQNLNPSSHMYDSLEQSTTADVSHDHSVPDKRRTYDLDVTSNKLDHSLDSGQSLEDSLERMSLADAKQCPSTEFKRRTYNLNDVVMDIPPDKVKLLEKLRCNNDIIESSETNHNSQDKAVGGTSQNSQNVDGNTDVSLSENSSLKRKTYTFDDMPSRNDSSLPSATDIQSSHSSVSKYYSNRNDVTSEVNKKPVDSVLFKLGSTGQNNKQEFKLTPGQQVKQMNGLKASPSNVSMEISKEGLVPRKTQTQKQKQSSGTKNNVQSKPPRRLPPASTSNLPKSSKSSSVGHSITRSKSVSGSFSKSELRSSSSSEMRLRSFSDSRSTSELKSNSAPDFSSNARSNSAKEPLLDSLKEVSPGVRNYLTNKLGLSEEQCLEVHRRLSGGSVGTCEPSKAENRKTYSLDDVAHSLDIATSQGLPMTEVLDNLELDKEKGLEVNRTCEHKETEEIPKDKDQTDSSLIEDQGNQSTVPEPNSTSMPSKEEKNSEKSGSVKYVTLQSNIIQSKFTLKRRTYILSNGNKTDGNVSSKDTSTTKSLDSLCHFKLTTKKSVYKPSTKLHSFSHLLGEQSFQNKTRNARRAANQIKRNTYSLESVAETLEKAQDAGVTMIDALKRLSGSCKCETSDTTAEKRKTYSLEDVSHTLENAAASGVPIVDALQKIADPDAILDGKGSETKAPLQVSKKKAPPKPKRTFRKPEIKFESDSFVIEYFTSPKKNLSASSEQDSIDGDVQELSNGSCSVSMENLDGKHGLPGKIESSSIVPAESHGSKPTDKVVNDLDSLLIELAAEVGKAKDSDPKGVERDTADHFRTSTPVRVTSESAAQKDTETNEQGSSVGLEDYNGCEELLDASDLPVQQVINKNCCSGHKNAVLVDKTQQESFQELAPVVKPDLLSGMHNPFLKPVVNNCFSTEHKDGYLVDKPSSGDQLNAVPKPDLLQQVEGHSTAISLAENILVDGIAGSVKEKTGDGKQTFTVGNYCISDDGAVDEGKCSSLSYIRPVDQDACAVEQPVGVNDGDLRKLSGTIGSGEISDGVHTGASEVEYIHLPNEFTDDVAGENHCNYTVEDSETEVDNSQDDVPIRSEPIEAGSVECSRKNESVSRELNLLRLKLAEKQRDIEAQKQRTKEQLEEERKRFGQNVFWFAVGKGRERKEPFDIKPPKEKIIQKTIELPLPNVSKKALNSSEVESSKANRFETFTKRSPEEELPPSMAKLQDRTYNLKTTDGSLRKSNSDLASRPQSSPRKDENSVSFANHSVTGRNQSEEVVHEFRLSRQTSGSQDSILHKVQMTSKTPSPGNSIDSEKPRTPVMNYKSRISVPLTYTAKPTSENSSDMTDSRNAVEATSVNPSYDMAGPENVMRSASRNLSEMDDLRNVVDSTSVLAGVPDTGNPNQAPMPARKRWDTDLGSNEEPQLAVSKSNHHLLEEHRIDGTDDSYGNRRAISKNSMNPHWMEQTTSKNAGTGSVMASPDRISGNSDDQSEFTRQADLEKNAVVLKGSPEGQHETMEATNNSPVSDNGLDTPKKGLALFIGDQKTAGEDGLTPEQLRKKERFLRNRQQKMEEEKMKKEATLEKKRRKEEKMKEIQLRREQEEHSRQQRLQQKKEQAEIAKMERQKYEQHRKENLSRMNYVDGVPSGYHSLPRTEVNHQSFALVTNEGYPYGFMNGPTSAPSPSAFSGFTGVQSYVKPSGKTNRKLIINAISHVCLPGAVNKDTKDKCLQAMTESSAQHFLILFREGLKFRGLYSLDPESNQVLKVHGVGPRSVTEKMIDRLYKYNSGAKEFSVIPAKGFSLSVDGFTLQKSCWQSSNKPTIASKTVSNYKSSSYRTVR